MSSLIERLKADLDRDLSGLKWQRLKAGDFYDMLQASECLLRNIAYGSGLCPEPQCATAGGKLEFGAALYFLHCPPEELSGLVKWAVRLLNHVEGRALPPTELTAEVLEKLAHHSLGEGFVAGDGTIWGTRKYEQLDSGWLTSLANFLWHNIIPDQMHKFETNPAVVSLTSETNSFTLGIVGDWGTGQYGSDGQTPSQAVMENLVGLNPDAIVHLGDVYYAGTHEEERDQMVSVWPPDYSTGTNAFTLNSNHEMYDGANAYYETLLAAKAFSAQQGTSYFALEFGEWIVLGLDSAYFSDPFHLYMIGSLGETDGPQLQWLRGLREMIKDKKVLVLTHHNPMATDGSSFQSDSSSDLLWNQVTEALQRVPDYWYFGHVHNGVVYTDKSVLGQKQTKARLCGHGAIPFGKAWELDQEAVKENIDYFSDTTAEGVRVRNGFAVVELHQDGTLSEKFFETVEGPSAPVQAWSSSATSAYAP